MRPKPGAEGGLRRLQQGPGLAPAVMPTAPGGDPVSFTRGGPGSLLLTHPRAGGVCVVGVVWGPGGVPTSVGPTP